MSILRGEIHLLTWKREFKQFKMVWRAILKRLLQGNKMIKSNTTYRFPYFKDKEHTAWVNDFSKRRIKAGSFYPSDS